MTLQHCFLTVSFSPRMDDDLLLRQQFMRSTAFVRMRNGTANSSSLPASFRVGPIGFTPQRVYEIAACQSVWC